MWERRELFWKDIAQFVSMGDFIALSISSNQNLICFNTAHGIRFPCPSKTTVACSSEHGLLDKDICRMDCWRNFPLVVLTHRHKSSLLQGQRRMNGFYHFWALVQPLWLVPCCFHPSFASSSISSSILPFLILEATVCAQLFCSFPVKKHAVGLATGFVVVLCPSEPTQGEEGEEWAVLHSYGLGSLCLRLNEYHAFNCTLLTSASTSNFTLLCPSCKFSPSSEDTLWPSRRYLQFLTALKNFKDSSFQRDL